MVESTRPMKAMIQKGAISFHGSDFPRLPHVHERFSQYAGTVAIVVAMTLHAIADGIEMTS